MQTSEREQQCTEIIDCLVAVAPHNDIVKVSGYTRDELKALGKAVGSNEAKQPGPQRHCEEQSDEAISRNECLPMNAGNRSFCLCENTEVVYD